MNFILQKLASNPLVIWGQASCSAGFILAALWILHTVPPFCHLVLILRKMLGPTPGSVFSGEVFVWLLKGCFVFVSRRKAVCHAACLLEKRKLSLFILEPCYPLCPCFCYSFGSSFPCEFASISPKSSYWRCNIKPSRSFPEPCYSTMVFILIAHSSVITITKS